MKINHLALAFSALVLSFTPRAARADEVSFQFFYDTLSPLGEWVQVGDYGECWHPTGVDADWAPYTDGYWSYTDAGWTWVSYEDFGGITYHYGRWVRTDDVGWCWVPDYEWGPAWVSWRNSDTDIGWAPLPPECRWRPSIGISTWCDDTYGIGPGCYTFCPIVEFGAPLIRTVCYPHYRNAFFIGHTVNITNICYNSYSNVIFCGGPNFAFVNEHSHRHVPSLKLVFNGNINHGGHAWTNAHNVGNTLQVYAPKIVNNNTTIINKPKITKVVNKTQINNGWNVVKDQGERQKLQAQIKEQNHGLTADNSPAKPVKVEDLKQVPAQADLKAPSPVAITNGGRGKDRNGDGIPDNQQGKAGVGNGPAVVGKDRNGDGIPDNQERKGRKGENPAAVGVDRNGDGIPDNQEGKGRKGGNPAAVGADRNGDGIPDHPNRGQGGFQAPGEKKPKVMPENGGLVPGGRDGNDQVERHEKQRNDGQVQQEEAARRRAEAIEAQRNAQARELQIEQQQQHLAEKQQRQAEAQQRAIENQRNLQIQRQQEVQQGRQREVQHDRPPQQQFVPPHPPGPQPNNSSGWGQTPQGQGGQGKGKNQPASDDPDAQNKKHGN